MPKKVDVNMDFTMQLNTVFDQYIVLKNVFVQSDVKKAKQAAQEVLQALSKVDMKLLTGDAHVQWMDISGNIETLWKNLLDGISELLRLCIISTGTLLITVLKIFASLLKGIIVASTISKEREEVKMKTPARKIRPIRENFTIADSIRLLFLVVEPSTFFKAAWLLIAESFALLLLRVALALTVFQQLKAFCIGEFISSLHR